MEAMPGHGRPRGDAGPQGPRARRGLRARAVRRLATAALALAATLVAAGPAWAQDDAYCTGDYGEDPPKAGPPIRFGIDSELAGSVGTGQGAAAPLDWNKDKAALARLTPPGKAMVLRVNRLFWADGDEGIERFRAIVDKHAAAGFDSEIQVRYHPADGDEGNIDKWVAYVRQAVRSLGADRHVVSMTITNEANLNISENTSDGAYDGVREALIKGIIAARAEADRIGRTDLPFGFTYAYRWNPGSDAAFWTALAEGGPEFRRALGFVGLDVYPGTFYPPTVSPLSSPGREVVIGIATLRHCFMPKAKLGPEVPIWLTENGFQSGADGKDEEQAAALEDMIASTVAVSGTYGVTDYRWFNLRDNVTGSPGFFETAGLLRDDYSEKPAFGKLRSLVAAHGAAQPRRCVRRITFTLPRRTHSWVARLDGRRVPGRRSGRTLTVSFRRRGKRQVVVIARTAAGSRVVLRGSATACPPAAARARAAASRRTIVTLGFDVATRDQTRALPLLAKYKMRATFFVNSGFVNTSAHLTWDQLRHMQAEGHEIAGQTISHARLTTLSRARMRHEVCDDRGRLLSQGLAADAFAYPFGAFNRTARSVVVGCGYSSARLASGIAGAGKKCIDCPFAESIPPRNRFATRMPAGVQRTSTLARLTAAVRNAKRHGGGWVQVLFHHVCRRCHRYSITRHTLDRFLGFLWAEPGVEVRTVSQLMDIDGPSVSARSSSRTVPLRATFRARAQAPHGVRRVRFFVDGRQVGIRNYAPWRLRYHTHRLTPGAHTLRVLLEDRRGNAAISPRTTFTKPAH